MSKGTVRFPESAIAGGRVGTARIRSEIAGAAARLADSTPAELGEPIRKLVSGPMLASEARMDGGRVGIERIHETITRAADQFASVDITPLTGALEKIARGMNQMVATPRGVKTDIPNFRNIEISQSTPLQRMQQLGRLPRGRKNKTESAYELEQLAPQLHAGEILWYRFEAIKLRLADNTFLTVDFPVITAAGELEFREVKGRWTDDARAKIKVAAAQFPWRFIAIHRVGRHGWRTEDLTSRSW